MNQQDIRATLSSFTYDGKPRDILKEQVIDAIEVKDRLVQIAFIMGNNPDSRQRHLALAVCHHVANNSDAQSVTPVFVSRQHGDKQPARPSQETSSPAAREKIDTGAKRVILVASGKGGVGKSTVAVNLAVALQQAGQKVGLLDADIYGPSLPTMLGHHQKPESIDGKIISVDSFGLKTMSIGYMIDPAKPVVWRGPMVMGAIEQMLKDVAWGNPDILVIDLPPGTGDAQLTLAQRVVVHDAIIVSTPQELALADVRRGIGMFRQVGIPVTGIIENMAYYACPCCGEKSFPFGNDGARVAAEEYGVAYLGGLPLMPELRISGDSSIPHLAGEEPSPEARQAFDRIVKLVMG